MVTGATGLVGSHLLCHLVQHGETVIALKREKSHVEETMALFSYYFDKPEEVYSRVNWVIGDVLDENSLSQYVKNVDAVYHCAAVVSFNGKDKNVLIETNVKGTENICRVCLKYGVRMCIVSSIATLGEDVGEGELIDEKTLSLPDAPHSLYSISKRKAENVVWKYIEQGLNAVIVNPAIILGTGLRGRSSVKLFEQAAKGMPFYTDGENGYVDVRDVCKLMIRLTKDREVRSERFVLCGGNYSYKELFTMISQVMGKNSPCIRMTPWMTEIAWRLLAVVAFFTGKKAVFTKETARSSQHKSRYSSAKILSLFPDYRFYTLDETACFFKQLM